MSRCYYVNNTLNKLLSKAVNQGRQEDHNILAKIIQIIMHAVLRKNLAALNLTLPPRRLLNHPGQLRLQEPLRSHYSLPQRKMSIVMEN